MSAAWMRLAGSAAGFVFIFASGFWLSHAGKPYGAILFNVHKVISVVVAVVLGVAVYQGAKADAVGALGWLLIVLAGVAFIAMIATGGVMSAVETPPAIAKTVHRIAPYATTLFTVAVLFLMARQPG